jgi:membrane protein insertase Oxa1/YidC/SpoIIIJ
MSPAELFTLVIYQPFFNILVFFYWALGLVTHEEPDMGIAVILLTILIRVLLLPVSLMEERSEAERRSIAHRVAELEQELAHDPVALKKEVRSLFKSKPRVVVGELFSLFIQASISLMLWRIFGSGLKGEDLHLLYGFMPKITIPQELVFMNTFDLSKSSWVLNLTQSVLIFVLETLAMYTSPYPPAKGEVLRMQLILPVVSFLIFMGLPAGKKLFVITALLFSIGITLLKFIARRFNDYRDKVNAAEQAAADAPSEEKVVVAVKE